MGSEMCIRDSRSALSRYRVSPGAGTCSSLEYLYGQDFCTNSTLAEAFLVHFWHQLKEQPCFVSKKDSLASLALCLCGWHRHRHKCSRAGKTMTVLQRAVLDVENEFISLSARFRDGETLDSEARSA